MSHYDEVQEKDQERKRRYEKFVADVEQVNHPTHYTSHPSGIEVIQITEHMGFCLGNAIKYIMRAGIKDPAKKQQDLEKAMWYIRREIEKDNKNKE